MEFKNQENLTDDNLKSFASTLNLDTDTFNKCLDSGQMKDRVNADANEGVKRNLAYTPSIYVNGKLVGWTSSEEFEKYIKSL
jgi:protein-disulfide isomerase